MEFDRSLAFKIDGVGFQFRTLRESDVNQEYMDGLKTQTVYIENIHPNANLETQKQYVKGIMNSIGDTICGLFTKGKLVGTAGIQRSLSDSFLRSINTPIKDLATVGIFVFNKNNRGKGLGKTLVWSATYLFYKCTKTDWFGAGMEKENVPSYKSFLSCGYQEVFNNEKYYKVLLHISELRKPELIREEKIFQYEN